MMTKTITMTDEQYDTLRQMVTYAYQDSSQGEGPGEVFDLVCSAAEPTEKPTKWYCCVCYSGFKDETEMLNHKSKSPECFCGPCSPIVAVGLPTRTT